MKGLRTEERIPISYLRSLFQEMVEFDITSVKISKNNETYEIKRGKQNLDQGVKKELQSKPEPASQKIQEPVSTKSETIKINKEKHKKTEREDDNLIEQKTPIVGTFYRAPSPDKEPFVEVGSKVKKGQALCIVEAMKAMNEIESDVNGIIEEILVENAKMVEYEQTLFKIRLDN